MFPSRAGKPRPYKFISASVVLGVVNNPAVSDTFWAVKASGSFKNGEKLAVSDCSEMSKSQFNFGSPKRIIQKGLASGFTRLIQNTYWQRCYGDYLNFAYVFEGKSEASLEVGVHAWDLAPMKIIVEEAGGVYSDLAGGDSIYTGSCLVSNKILHKEFLSMLMGN